MVDNNGFRDYEGEFGYFDPRTGYYTAAGMDSAAPG